MNPLKIKLKDTNETLFSQKKAEYKPEEIRNQQRSENRMSAYRENKKNYQTNKEEDITLDLPLIKEVLESPEKVAIIAIRTESDTSILKEISIIDATGRTFMAHKIKDYGNRDFLDPKTHKLIQSIINKFEVVVCYAFSPLRKFFLIEGFDLPKKHVNLSIIGGIPLYEGTEEETYELLDLEQMLIYHFENKFEASYDNSYYDCHALLEILKKIIQ